MGSNDWSCEFHNHRNVSVNIFANNFQHISINMPETFDFSLMTLKLTEMTGTSPSFVRLL